MTINKTIATAAVICGSFFTGLFWDVYRTKESRGITNEGISCIIFSNRDIIKKDMSYFVYENGGEMLLDCEDSAKKYNFYFDLDGDGEIERIISKNYQEALELTEKDKEKYFMLFEEGERKMREKREKFRNRIPFEKVLSKSG